VTEEQYRNEKRYQTTMHVIRRMLREGLITPDEYRKIDTIFSEKYAPVFGGLLIGNDLLSGEYRANMDTERS